MKKKLLTVALSLIMIITMMPAGFIYGLTETPSSIPKGAVKTLTLEETLSYASKNNSCSFHELKTLLGNYNPKDVFDVIGNTASDAKIEAQSLEKVQPYSISNAYDVVYSDGTVETFRGWIYELNLYKHNSDSLEGIKNEIEQAVLSGLASEGNQGECEVAVEKYDEAAANALFGDIAPVIAYRYENYEECAKRAGYGLHLRDVYLVKVSSAKDAELNGQLFVMAMDTKNVVESVSVSKMPDKYHYVLGEETLDVSGGMIECVYTDASKENVSMDIDMLIGYEDIFTSAGKRAITVMYGGKQTSFEISVTKEPVSAVSMEINTMPSGKTYYGDAQFNIDGASVKVTYDNGDQRIFDVTRDMIPEQVPADAGKHTVIIGFSNQSVPMELEVLPADLTSADFKLEYESCTYSGKEMKPAVTCDGLKEGVDYTVDYADNIKAGRATVIITGKGNFTGVVKKGFDIKKPGIDFILGAHKMGRVYGPNRFQTAIKVARSMRLAAGADKFDTIVVADGLGYADALSGTYLAAVKNAPILTVGKDDVSQKLVADYIAENLKADGQVYILGGFNAVSEGFSDKLTNDLGVNVKRLGGLDRYSTNLMILEEAGVGESEILVCSGTGFADSLSASATGKPILLVGKTMTAEQKEFLGQISLRKYFIIGGYRAVSMDVEYETEEFGSVERLTGDNRFETSVAVANRFFSGKCETAVIAYGMNFPDGLSGGPFAYELGGPLLLATSNNTDYVENYVKQVGIEHVIALGGPKLISDSALSKIMY